MAPTCTWVKDRTGALAMKWTIDEAPIRHRRKPEAPGKTAGARSWHRISGGTGGPTSSQSNEKTTATRAFGLHTIAKGSPASGSSRGIHR